MITRLKPLGFGCPLFAALLATALLTLPTVADHHKASGDVTISQKDDRLVIKINGDLFTEYLFKNVDRPFFYPVVGPTGANVTRNFPMNKGVAGEEPDHPHHTGLWFTHGNVNGFDFWHKTKIHHHEIKSIRTGDGKGGFTAINHWIDPDGKVLITEERTITIHGSANPKILDFETTLHATGGDITFGDTKEGSMAIRLAPTLRLEGKVAGGQIVNSEGVSGKGTWGKRAKWVDYHGPLEGKHVGVAIMDHPDNPRHPTWWHVRSYGLFAANPFGIHDFEKKPAGTGDLSIDQGERLTFRYRFVFHEGDEQAAKIERHYQQWTQ